MRRNNLSYRWIRKYENKPISRILKKDSQFRLFFKFIIRFIIWRGEHLETSQITSPNEINFLWNIVVSFGALHVAVFFSCEALGALCGEILAKLKRKVNSKSCKIWLYDLSWFFLDRSLLVDHLIVRFENLERKNLWLELLKPS